MSTPPCAATTSFTLSYTGTPKATARSRKRPIGHASRLRPLQRPAWDQAGHHEDQQGDTDQGGDDEKNAPNEIVTHEASI